jgi:hypothetical protein
MKDFEKENIKIISSFNKRLILVVSFILSAVASAKEFVVPPMSTSAYADTEVTTNIAINTQVRGVSGDVDLEVNVLGVSEETMHLRSKVIQYEGD